jgi:hypothetical protein
VATVVVLLRVEVLHGAQAKMPEWELRLSIAR